jgi:glucose/arabinose dehydrogenase
MPRLLRRISLAVAGVTLVAVGACQLCLPKGFVVNADIGNLLLGRGIDPPPPDALRERLRVPPGFALGRFAEGVENARMLRFTPAGDLLVSQPRLGRIGLLLRDENGDGRADGLVSLVEGLNRPHGLDLRDGWLYIGETDAVARIRFDPATRKTSGALERVVTGLPGGGNHWSRTLRFGPDGMMYVHVGSSCNACLEKDPRRATMMRFRPDGSDPEIFASGLRNSVGFDWKPDTGELYATDNGRDLLGDDFPPCELNRLVQGGFYGWPFANADRVPDPDFGAGHEAEIARTIPPVHGFRPHNAPLGMTFVRGEGAPEALRGAALVALHGSWNRSKKDGYKVVSLHWGDDGAITERDFVSGFERDGDVIGRPVDVAEGPDGAFYISDDYAGSILRVAWGEAPRREAEPSTTGAQPAAAGAASNAARAPEDPAAVERGRALWERHGCAECHDPERAKPGMVTKTLAGLASRYTVTGLDAFLVTPTPPMPVFPLSSDDRRDLVAYLRATHP